MTAKHSTPRSTALIALAASLLTLAQVSGQDAQAASPDPAATEDPVHNELRAFRLGVLEAVKARDIDAILKFTTPDVVVTWQNNEVWRGQEEVRKSYEAMGKEIFKSYKVEPTSDVLTTMYGDDTGVGFGHSIGSYSLLGKEFDFENRWTGTLVKVDGKWLLASYHVSVNALDNPILDAAKGTVYWALGGGLLLGLGLGFLFFRRRKV